MALLWYKFDVGVVLVIFLTYFLVEVYSRFLIFLWMWMFLKEVPLDIWVS